MSETLAVRPNMIQAFTEACRLGHGEIVLKQNVALKLLSEIEAQTAEIKALRDTQDELAEAVQRCHGVTIHSLEPITGVLEASFNAVKAAK